MEYTLLLYQVSAMLKRTVPTNKGTFHCHLRRKCELLYTRLLYFVHLILSDAETKSIV